MPIRLECPNPACKVKLTVKDHLAGKRVPCPRCKQPITVPVPVDVEALAASALDDDAATKQAQQASTIDYTCPFCDEELHLPRVLGGKQTSCTNPECRRIIKVPMPKDERPEDWRNITRTGPTGARENVEAAPLDGAWDTSRATVSGEALVEAGVVPETVEPVTTAQWIRRSVAGTATVIVLVVAVVWVRSFWSSGHLRSLLDQGLSYADVKSKLNPEWKAELERAGGEFYLDAGQQEKALEHFGKARSLLKFSQPGTERDAGLRDLALIQTRLQGDDLGKELGRTLSEFGEPEARLIAFREVIGKLLAGKRDDVALALVQRLGGAERPVTSPKPGAAKQEQTGDPDDGEAKAQATPVKKKQEEKPAVESLLPSQRIAVALALKQPGQAAEVKERPVNPKEEPSLIARLGYAEGLARQDLYSEAERLAKMPGPALDRLQTWLALGDIAWDAGKNDDARRYAAEARVVFEKELKGAKLSPWHVWQLSRAEARTGRSEAKALADTISDGPLKGRAQLEILLLQLEGNKGRMKPSTIDATVSEKASLAYGLAMEKVVRHNLRSGGDAEGAGELTEEVRPFAFLGAALGTQDRTR